MGLLGAMTGAGQGMADFGKMGVANAFETERDKTRLEAQERMQEKHDAAAEERAKRIEEWRAEAELKKLDDPRYIGAKKRQAELDAANAANKAEAEESAKVRAKNSPDALKIEERAHQRKLSEINAEADAKARAEKTKESGVGGWKPDALQKAAYAEVAKGMGLDAQSLVGVDDATHRKLASITADVVEEFNKNPDAGLPAAHRSVMERITSNMKLETDTKAREKDTRKQVEKEANKGILGIGGVDFGPEGREAWIERKVQERLQNSTDTPSATPPKNSSTMSALPAGIPAGSKQIGTSGGKPVYEAPNGKRYIVE